MRDGMLARVSLTDSLAFAFAVVLALGASTQFFLLTDWLQPYCGSEIDGTEPCRPCGLKWGMFGIVEPTPCPGSVLDEVLFVLVLIPRFVVVLAGMVWPVTVPAIILWLVSDIRRWRRGGRTRLRAAQIAMIAYVSLHALALVTFFALPMLSGLS